MALRPKAGSKAGIKGKDASKRRAEDPPTPKYSRKTINRLKPNDKMLWKLKLRGAKSEEMQTAWDRATGRQTRPEGMERRLKGLKSKLDALKKAANESAATENSDSDESISSNQSHQSSRKRRADEEGTLEHTKRQKTPPKESTMGEQHENQYDRDPPEPGSTFNVLTKVPVISDPHKRSTSPARRRLSQPVGSPRTEFSRNDRRKASGRGGRIRNQVATVSQSTVTVPGADIGAKTGEVLTEQSKSGSDNVENNTDAAKKQSGGEPGDDDEGITGQGTVLSGTQDVSRKNKVSQGTATTSQPPLEDDIDADNGDGDNGGDLDKSDSDIVQGEGVPPFFTRYTDPMGRGTLDGYYALLPYSKFLPSRINSFEMDFDLTKNQCDKAVRSAHALAKMGFEWEFEHHGDGNMKGRIPYQVARQVAMGLPKVAELITGIEGESMATCLLLSLTAALEIGGDLDEHFQQQSSTCPQIAESIFWAYLTHEILQQQVLASLGVPDAKGDSVRMRYRAFLGRQAEWEPTQDRLLWRDFRKDHWKSEEFQALLKQRAEDLACKLEDIISVLFEDEYRKKFNDGCRPRFLQTVLEVLNMNCKMELSSLKFGFIWPKINERFDDDTMDGGVADKDDPAANYDGRHQNRIRYCPSLPIIKARRPLGNNKYGMETWEIEQRAEDEWRRARDAGAGPELKRGDGF